MTITAVGVTERLAEYALALRHEDIPEPVLRRTKELFLDFLGVALGGRQTESTVPIVEATRSLLSGGTGPCTVVGEAETFPPHHAALLNATLAHSMDFDDTHAGSRMHIGTPLFATLLAIGEAEGASGREFLAAAVAGYDVAGKLGNAHGDSVHRRGFHPTATTGVFASAAAGGRLMGLGLEQVVNALGLNASQAAGSQQFLENGAWNKRLQVGLASHNAIYSLAFARHGFKGAAKPLEGSFGYFKLYCQDGYDLEKAVSGLGREFEVMATAVKPYPCCRFNHGPIDGVLALMRKHRLKADDIAAIDVSMDSTGYTVVGHPAEPKRRPADVVEGQFSLYFAAAYVALRGAYTWEAYDDLADPAVLRMMQKVNVQAAPHLTGFQSEVTITTVAGRRLTQLVASPKGEPDNPLTPGEMADKFRSLARGALSPTRVESVVASVDKLEAVANISNLTRHLRA